MSSVSAVHLYWCRCSGTAPKPIVVLLAWVWAEEKHLEKYTEMINRYAHSYAIAIHDNSCTHSLDSPLQGIPGFIGSGIHAAQQLA